MFVHMLRSRTYSEPRFSTVSVTLTCSAETINLMSLLIPNFLACVPLKRTCLHYVFQLLTA